MLIKCREWSSVLSASLVTLPHYPDEHCSVGKGVGIFVQCCASHGSFVFSYCPEGETDAQEERRNEPAPEQRVVINSVFFRLIISN